MANPTPILQQINAFDATKGTTINYSVVGGTDIIRSSRIKIYNATTNELKLDYLYTGIQQSAGQYIIVLPSVQTSANLSNETQYYASVETYTNTNGTGGASGYSTAKIFWCLPEPTLTLTQPPSIINTTSYNAQLIYNTNITGDISATNKSQQYRFDLYEQGVKVQTSGNIIGAGVQQSTPTEYLIEYNFTGLKDGSAYYIVATITSTEGMMITTEPSNSFVVEINTPSFNQATVVNDACDGYITITSKITNIEGESNVEVSDGYIDLTPDGAYVIWDDGVTFPTINNKSQWNLFLWGKKYNYANYIESNQMVLNLKSVVDLQSTGDIKLYLTQNTDLTKIRLELYVDIYGDNTLIGTYFSDYIDKPADDDNLLIQVKCNLNWFDFSINKME